jgi:pilus assembly protein Flp/PilA
VSYVWGSERFYRAASFGGRRICIQISSDGRVVCRALGSIVGLAQFIARRVISIVIRQALGVVCQCLQEGSGIAAIKRARDIMRKLLRFLRSEDGPTAVEYAVMLALIVIACMASIQALTQETAGSYNRSSDAIEAAINGGGP